MTAIDEPRIASDVGNGVSTLLVHPLGADYRYWSPIVEHLPPGRSIAYNLPGHGGRPAPSAPYDIADLGDDAVRLLDSAGIEAARIVGVSIGGMVAQDVAARYPDRCIRIALVDTVPHYPPDFAANLTARAQLVREAGTAALVDATLALWFTTEFVADDPGATLLVTEMLSAASPDGYARACEALVSSDLRELAARIDVPTTIICGSNDVPAFIEGAGWLHEAIPHSTLHWVEGGRHAAAFERAADFGAILRRAWADQ